MKPKPLETWHTETEYAIMSQRDFAIMIRKKLSENTRPVYIHISMNKGVIMDYSLIAKDLELTVQQVAQAVTELDNEGLLESIRENEKLRDTLPPPAPLTGEST